MIGILVTGHAEFASGLASAMNLLTGEAEAFQSVNFPAGMDQYDLLEQLKQAKQHLSDCDQWIVLTDIIGGTPFKMSVMLSMQEEHIRVLTGINLPLLLQMVLSRSTITDVDELISTSIEESKKTMLEFHPEDYLS